MFKKLFAVLTTVAILATSSVALAADTTSSPTAGGSPEVVSASILDKDGKELATLSASEIIVTPYKAKDSADETIKKNLEAAYDQTSKKAVKDLSTDVAAYAEAKKVSVDSLVVSELFDVTVIGDNSALIGKDGNVLKVTFKTSTKKDDFMMVMTDCGILNGDAWKVIPASNVVVADGSTTVCFTELCPVLFVTDSVKINPDKNVPAPQTGETTTAMVLSVLAVVLVAGAAVLFVSKKNAR